MTRLRANVRDRWLPCTWEPLVDPLDKIAAGIATRDDARFWIRFFEAVCRVLTSSEPWPTIDWLDDVRPGERSIMRDLRAVHANVTLRDSAVRRLESCLVRLRIAWELDS